MALTRRPLWPCGGAQHAPEDVGRLAAEAEAVEREDGQGEHREEAHRVVALRRDADGVVGGNTDGVVGNTDGVVGNTEGSWVRACTVCERARGWGGARHGTKVMDHPREAGSVV